MQKVTLTVRSIAFISIFSFALIVAAFRFAIAWNGPSASPPSGSGAIAADASLNVGVGTSTPQSRLHVIAPNDTTGPLRGDISSNSAGDRARLMFVRTRGTATSPTGVQVGDVVSDIASFAHTGSALANVALIRTTIGATVSDPNLSGRMQFYTRGTESTTVPAERMRIDENGFVGIATTTPSALLTVGTSTTGLVANFGGGIGKINVGTVDPIYRIGGEQYATYLPGMTGVKEETTGVLALRPAGGGTYRAVIDLGAAPRGSDLWLFAKTTRLAEQFPRMTVLLTPNFDGALWYERNAAGLRVMVYGRPSSPAADGALEASYRLTAPRFDDASWPNTNTDQGVSGFVIDE